MDIKSMLLMIGALIGIIALFLYFKRKEREKQKKVKALLDKFAKKQNLTFSIHDYWGAGNAIGLDASGKVLFHTNSMETDDAYALFKLADVEKCAVVNDHRDINGTRVIEQIRLNLTFKGSRTHQSLLFYDKEKNIHFTNELALAEKWKNIVGLKIDLKSNSYSIK